MKDVATYLGDEIDESDNPVLLILIQRAIRKVCAKQGADGESSHNENGISRAHEKEDDIYFDIVPVVKIL